MGNLVRNNRGFTLTEVLIGIMILTIAITAATNLLVNLRTSNEANNLTIQAYYYAGAGIEAVRNIRDSNWLHNRDWLAGDIWGSAFEPDKTYSVDLTLSSFGQGSNFSGANALQTLALASPFRVSSGGQATVFNVKGEKTIFEREILISRVEDYEPDEAILVTSQVTFQLKGKERKVVMKEVLTNWKDGVF